MHLSGTLQVIYVKYHVLQCSREIRRSHFMLTSGKFVVSCFVGRQGIFFQNLLIISKLKIILFWVKFTEKLAKSQNC